MKFLFHLPSSHVRPDRVTQDKQAVERHKAAIKDKLSKAGMIRGVPRQPATSGASGGSSSAAGPSRPTITSGGLSSASPYPYHSRSRPYFPVPSAHTAQAHAHRPHNYGAMHSLSTAPVSAGSMPGQHTDIDYFNNAQSALAMPDQYTHTVGMPGESLSFPSPPSTSQRCWSIGSPFAPSRHRLLLSTYLFNQRP